uniref:G-patch domain-containing protein n=1 Tax=Anopheles quadriannulatus TaxID=34691 RepID=A0A182XM06_ANOQN
MVKKMKTKPASAVPDEPQANESDDASEGNQIVLIKSIKKKKKFKNLESSLVCAVPEESPANDSDAAEKDPLEPTELPRKKKKLRKQKNLNTSEPNSSEECNKANVEEEPFDIYKLRNPLEEEEHWQLRLAFLEKNQHVLSPDELVCLAQVYMNIELLRCTYPRETMEQVSKLAEGIGGEYHRKRAFMLKRTFVSASDAAACKVRRDDPSTILKATDKPAPPKEPQDSSNVPSIPTFILNCLRSDLIILNDMRHTMQMFNQVNKDGLQMEAIVHTVDKRVFRGSVVVGGITIAKSQESTNKLAMRIVLERAKERLSKYCYSVIRKKNATEVEGIEVVSKSSATKSTSEGQSMEQEPDASNKLDAGNIGFQLLAKLGWSGAGLGARGDGIVNPISVEQKVGRQGLGGDSSEGAKLDRTEIRKKLQDLRDGKLAEHCIVFSNEYSKDDRKLIHEIARKLRLKSQSHGNENQGNRRLVVSLPPLRPSELLRKIIVEKDETFCKMFEVTPPTEQE